MPLLLTYAITLAVAVLVSGLARRTVLSVAVIFLAAGVLLGVGAFGPIPAIPDGELELAELALFSVLFNDGMRTGGWRHLSGIWGLPTRALLLGMPLTIGGVALLARGFTTLSWTRALLLGAALSPTDPVFVSAIFRFESVPERVKRLLNVESGINDGLSLPVVMLLLAGVNAKGATVSGTIGELLLGIGLGIGIPWMLVHLEKSRFFDAVGLFHPLTAFSFGLLVLAVSAASGANLFLAAFGAGITLATVGPAFTKSYRQFGELVTELLELAALLAFGAAIAPTLFSGLPWREYLFVVLAIFAVRPVAIVMAMTGSNIGWRDTLLTGWFGPKGFASVVYGILIFQAGYTHVAHLIALGVAISITVYSSTDVPITRRLESRDSRS